MKYQKREQLRVLATTANNYLSLRWKTINFGLLNVTDCFLVAFCCHSLTTSVMRHEKGTVEIIIAKLTHFYCDYGRASGVWVSGSKLNVFGEILRF